MFKNPGRPPVIILGMHRSGTTFLVRILIEIGFFCGNRIDTNLEALFFQRRNEWLMRRAGGAWDYPIPIKAIYKIEALKLEAERILARSVNSWQFAEFTGSIFNTNSLLVKPWGWKDPRNIFTLKLWLKTFPGAKILYIKRNGVDVANSLFVRHNAVLTNGSKNVLSIRPLKSRFKNCFQLYENYIRQSIRCVSLTESFKLWEEYTSEAEDIFEWFNGEKMAIRYEDLLKRPDEIIKEIAIFCGLNFKSDTITRMVSAILTDKAFAFTNNKLLINFYEKVKDTVLMQKLGYQTII